MRRLIVLAFTALLLFGVVPNTAAGKGRSQGVTGVRVTEGIVFGQGRVNAPAAGRIDLRLDLYEPLTRSNGRRPAVLLIHGGGFVGGSRAQPDLVRVARGLAERGSVVLSIDYRLLGQDPVPSPRVAPVEAAAPDVAIFTAMVAAVDDSLTALDWLDGHEKELRVHPNRLGIVGGSAGAITANHVAYALDDLGVGAPDFRFVGDLWGGIYLPAPTPAAAAQLNSGEAPLFAVHGSADRLVPVALDDWLVARARSVGVPAEYHRVEGGAHGFAGTGFFTREVAPGQTAFDRLLDFAASALRR